MPGNTILDIALSNPDILGDADGDFDILGAAIGLFPDLAQAAGNPGASLTVFAPTDQAFLSLANAVDLTVGSDEGKAVGSLLSLSALLSSASDPAAFLKTVLTYHIAGEALTGTEVASSRYIYTISGETIRPDGLTLGDKDPDFADPVVMNPAGSENGIVADNGVLHVIDSVLLPYDITISEGGFVLLDRGPDVVIGSEGFDFISLGRGNDIANGLDGVDFIFGGFGRDLMIGGDGNDKLLGGRGRDTLEGGEGRDYLSGGQGRDILIGEEGNDYLKGGNSRDAFVFSPFREGEGHDVVLDFNPKCDKLVLDLSKGSSDLLALIAAEGEEGLQFSDLLTFDANPDIDGVQAPVSIGASGDGDLLITHLTGTIELNHIPSDVDPAALIPAIEFILPDDTLVI